MIERSLRRHSFAHVVALTAAVLMCILVIGCSKAPDRPAATMQPAEPTIKRAAEPTAARLLENIRRAAAESRYVDAKAQIARLKKHYPDSSEAAATTAISELIAGQEKARIAAATANLKTETDEFKGITWYRHKNSPVLATKYSLYFGISGESAPPYPLRQYIMYYASDWLFVKSISIKADDAIFQLATGEFERDNGSHIWEWSDEPVENFPMLHAMLKAKRVVIRFEGNQYHKDFLVPQAQLDQAREVLTAWEAYGGHSR